MSEKTVLEQWYEKLPESLQEAGSTVVQYAKDTGKKIGDMDLNSDGAADFTQMGNFINEKTPQGVKDALGTLKEKGLAIYNENVVPAAKQAGEDAGGLFDDIGGMFKKYGGMMLGGLAGVIGLMMGMEILPLLLLVAAAFFGGNAIANMMKEGDTPPAPTVGANTPVLGKDKAVVQDGPEQQTIYIGPKGKAVENKEQAAMILAGRKEGDEFVITTLASSTNEGVGKFATGPEGGTTFEKITSGKFRLPLDKDGAIDLSKPEIVATIKAAQAETKASAASGAAPAADAPAVAALKPEQQPGSDVISLLSPRKDNPQASIPIFAATYFIDKNGKNVENEAQADMVIRGVYLENAGAFNVMEAGARNPKTGEMEHFKFPKPTAEQVSEEASTGRRVAMGNSTLGGFNLSTHNNTINLNNPANSLSLAQMRTATSELTPSAPGSYEPFTKTSEAPVKILKEEELQQLVTKLSLKATTGFDFSEADFSNKTPTAISDGAIAQKTRE